MREEDLGKTESRRNSLEVKILSLLFSLQRFLYDARDVLTPTCSEVS